MTIGLGHRMRLKQPGIYLIFCPGCMRAHELEIGSRQEYDKRLGFDGNLDRPSFDPVVVAHTTMGLCKFELRAGRLRFALSSFHDLAGQEVELPHFPLP